MWNEHWKVNCGKPQCLDVLGPLEKLICSAHVIWGGGLSLSVLITTQLNSEPRWPCSAFLSATGQILAPTFETLHG